MVPRCIAYGPSEQKKIFFKSPQKIFSKNIFFIFPFLSNSSSKVGLGGLWKKSEINFLCHFLELNFFAVLDRGGGIWALLEDSESELIFCIF